jgi:hypothetical protein
MRASRTVAEPKNLPLPKLHRSSCTDVHFLLTITGISQYQIANSQAFWYVLQLRKPRPKNNFVTTARMSIENDQ